MKKLLLLLVAVSFVALACVTNPGKGPDITVAMPEMYSPDPDKANDLFVAPITVKHPVAIKDWEITVRTARRQTAAQGTEQGAQRPAANTQRPAADATPAAGDQPRQPRAPFYQKKGTGKPPAKWEWDGKNTDGTRSVQSMAEYQFTLTASDNFGNSSKYEGIINVDLLVIREGDQLRIVVPAIVFPPDSADFKRLTDAQRRGNERVLRTIGNALNKYADYKVTVEGHSNPTTAPNTAARNTEETKDLKPLSEKRAQAVIDYLAANNNVQKARLTAVGIGGTRTVAEYNDADDNWQNRRVEFILKK
jgi:outer membrane protein OmpA-like peptidoglycan-associated protein/predicted small secreted protein